MGRSKSITPALHFFASGGSTTRLALDAALDEDQRMASGATWRRRILVGIAVIVATLLASGALLWNSPYAFMGAARSLAQWHFGVEVRTITVDGHFWPYLEGGRRDAPAVVLLHGYNTSMDAMMSIMSWLEHDHRVIAPDLPGFGRHEVHAGSHHDGAFYAREVLRFMDALGVERASIVGTSMGGAIAAEIAILAPERVERLVLLAPAGLRAPIENDFMRRANAGENPLRLESEEDFDRIIQLVFRHPPPTPEPVRRYFTLEAKRRLPGTNRIIDSLAPFVREGLEGRLGAIRAPTLILWGEHDLVLDPSLLQVFGAAITGSRTALVPDAGHVLFHDAPGAVRAELVPFLAVERGPPQ